MKAGDKRPLRPWLIAGTTSQRRTASRRRSSSNFPTTEQQQFPNNRIEAPNISFHLGLACQPDSPRLLSSCCLLRQGAEGGWGKFGVDFCTSAAAKHCDNSTFEYVLDWFQISLETGLEPDVIHEHRFNQFFIHHSLCAAQVRQKLTFPEELLPLDCKSALENYFASDYSCSMFRCLLSVCSCTDPVSLSACLWSVLCLNSLTCWFTGVAVAKTLSQTPCSSSGRPTSGAARTRIGLPICKCSHTLTLWGICNPTSECKIKQNKTKQNKTNPQTPNCICERT